MINMDTHANYKEAQLRHFESEGVSPVSHFVETNGPVHRVHYVRAGEGEPLIMVHGGGGSLDQWINIIKPLQEKFSLYIVDRPGCGLTDKFDYNGVNLHQHAIDFLKSFIKAIGLDRVNIAANSMGGMWSLLYAIQFPETVNKLVLLGAPAGIYDEKLPFFIRLLGKRKLNRLLYKTIAKPSIKGSKQVYKQLLVADVEKLSQQFIECAYWSSIQDGAVHSWLGILENLSGNKGMRSEYLISSKLGGLKTKTLMLWGDRDAFNTIEEGREVCKNHSTIELRQVEDAGHLPWLDQPELCSNQMIAFLQ